MIPLDISRRKILNKWLLVRRLKKSTWNDIKIYTITGRVRACTWHRLHDTRIHTIARAHPFAAIQPNRFLFHAHIFWVLDSFHSRRLCSYGFHLYLFFPFLFRGKRKMCCTWFLRCTDLLRWNVTMQRSRGRRRLPLWLPQVHWENFKFRCQNITLDCKTNWSALNSFQN